MLTRAARREAQYFLSKRALASYERLQLPWLCPSVSLSLECQRRHGTASTIKRLSKKARRPDEPTRPALHGATHPRCLATNAAIPFTPSEDYVPFDDKAHPFAQEDSTQNSERRDYSLFKPIDPSHLIHVPEHVPDQALVWKKKNSTIMGGDVADIQQNLYACVHVGRSDRAAALVHRLEEIYQPEAPELLDAHNQHLTGLLEALVRSPSLEGLIVIQKWFEVDIRAKGVIPNATTISIMIKAAMSALSDLKIDRTIRRYLNIAKTLGPEVEQDTLTSSIFSESEWSRMIRLLHQDNVGSQEDMPEDPVDTTLQQSEAQAYSTAGTSVPSIPADSQTSSTIAPVAMKGYGLKALNTSLSSFYDSENLTSKQNEKGLGDKGTLHKQQTQMERDVLDSAIAKWRADHDLSSTSDLNTHYKTSKLGTFLWEWILEISPIIKADIEFSDTAADQKKLGTDDLDLVYLGPYLKLLPVDKLVAASLHHLIGKISNQRLGVSMSPSIFAIPLGATVQGIGRSIQLEIIAELSKADRKWIWRKNQSIPHRMKAWNLYVRRNRQLDRPIQGISHIASGTESPLLAEHKWSNALIVKLGAYLLSKIIKVAKLPVTKIDPVTGREAVQVQRIASQGSQYHKGKKIGTLKIHPELVSRLQREPVRHLIAKHLPMLVEPQPWTALNEGGYLTSKLKMVRFRDASYSQENYVRAAIEKGNMDQVFAGLNVIGKVPWSVNRDVFQVMVDAWNTGEAIGGLAPRDPQADYPPEPIDSLDLKQRRIWNKMVKQIENEKDGFHSQRCYQNFQLEVARAFLEHEFYCPHTLDFRGRAYPLPPYFNHMGADNCRGLLVFAKGKELGVAGLVWLKVHLANVYGYDKASLKDREEFTTQHLNDIYDSAKNPLNGRRWWLTAEDPWQCLAACIDLTKALDSPVPARHVSHIPIHQDGTCNGLQHYAALGGDAIGAQQVNLVASDRPADIYTAVAELVKSSLEADAANGDTNAQILNGKITRKVVKQTVMTNVYGVTFFGARDQVKRQLVDVFPKQGTNNPVDLGVLAGVVAHKIFAALGSMFGGAHAIQDWLGECAGRITRLVTPEQIQRMQAKSNGERPPSSKKRFKSSAIRNKKQADEALFKSTVVWTTPLGMPVVQPYRDSKADRISTNLQQISIGTARASDPVSKKKQLQGFPPNFIHSLDATHMLLSAIKCDELGLTFAAVHDSFWTHASDVPTMNRILRDAFVRMHSEPVIERLGEEFAARYKGCMYQASLKLDMATSKKISAWRTENAPQLKALDKEYSVGELLLEYKRLQLLRSAEPEEQRQGRAMVTPASILEASQVATDELKPQVRPALHLGNVPGSTDSNRAGRVADEDSVADADVLQDLENDVDAVAEEDKAVGESDTSRASTANDKRALAKLIWLPVSFPRAPPKGDFDVSRLRDSQYFFS